MSKTQGRSVVVTGGASGIGLAIAAAFRAIGDHVVSLDIEQSTAANLSVCGDVREPSSSVAAVAAAVDACGQLDVLVVNAGIHDGGAGFGLPADDLAAVTRRVMDIDVLGYILSVQAAAPALAASRGSVIFTLSDSTFLAGQTGAGVAYTAAKYAAHGVMKWCAHNLAPDVRVNAVAPGGVVTHIQAVSADGSGRSLFVDADAKREVIRSRNPLGTVLEPSEVAQLYVFLASEAARGMTGEVLRPDGGLSVR
ncbi:MAG: SDR family oxidoreductase [Actinobacteria bacterium]|nr:SDR family oxidoreductase [Actinomycetota bacterium]